MKYCHGHLRFKLFKYVSVTDFSVLSNFVATQNISCMGLCGRNICPKCYHYHGLDTFNPQLAVSIL